MWAERPLVARARIGSPEKATFWLRFKNAHAQTSYQRLGSTADVTLAAARKTARDARAHRARRGPAGGGEGQEGRADVCRVFRAEVPAIRFLEEA